MPKRSDDYSSIMNILVGEDMKDLNLVDQEKHDFPFGVDDFIGRRWIINAIDGGSVEAVRWMLNKGVSLQFRDEEGYTVLHACVERKHKGKYEIMRDLVAAGADINAKGLNDWTPLHMAAARNDVEAVEILLASGADTTIRTTIDNFATPEEEAISLGAIEAAQFIRDRVARDKL